VDVFITLIRFKDIQNSKIKYKFLLCGLRCNW